MIKIRLSRQGVRGKPFYRIVATDHKLKVKGPALDVLGTWQPAKKSLKIDKEKLDSWLKSGAQMSLAVKKLLKP